MFSIKVSVIFNLFFKMVRRRIYIQVCCFIICFFVFSSCINVNAEQLIRVNNMTGREICEFYISAHNEEDWGDDAFELLDRCVRHNEYADVT